MKMPDGNAINSIRFASHSVESSNNKENSANCRCPTLHSSHGQYCYNTYFE
jgi:hypothetical protein